MNPHTPPISSELTVTAPISSGQAAALTALIPEWQLALRAENKSPGTIAVYSDGTERYLRWCKTTNAVPMARTSLHTWMAELLDTGSAPGTVRTRQLAVRRFAAWLIATSQLPGDPFVGIKGPAQRYPVVMPLSDDELRALIATCTTPTHRRGEPLHHRRDEAIIRLMMETGIRAGELIALHTGDLDLPAGRITIRLGKGGRGRVIPVGPATARALEAYLELRRDHPGAEESAVWLGARGTSFRYDGLGRALRRRAKLAGIDGFHPHRLRHTAAHRWLAKGGSESGLMAMAGWTRTDMLVRYTRATAGERAAAEARRLDLGNL
ncbi:MULTISPECIES: tyrosine-type recombinase/integrase [unclassified Nocardioides]|uniref:tyrosine-type recombinase/integrase n=1 Tax=unclassified Nocardioides TaxID=2615069 RepID=UPI0009F06AE3|nr:MULTISPECIES: tyrosine-type recombinase/integrase [unclassified Nocardioides]GAW48984.1 Integrase family protein [Nocardioides sp. PD653-B2]GAW55199.1 Integrase family protein [Nocardioides sp. PD653]HWI42192.1 tyrosine-type recombinase/integrase [Nocardioides sp.]